MSGSGGGREKTEAPSARKLKEAKDQGQTPRTQDLSSWASIAAMAVTAPAVVALGHEKLAAALLRVDEVVADPEPAVAIDVLVDSVAASMLRARAHGGRRARWPRSRRSRCRAASTSPGPSSSPTSSGSTRSRGSSASSGR